MWQDGLLSKDKAGVQSPAAGSDEHLGGQFEVPPLVACVDSGGGFAVVVVGNGEQACRDAGLDPAGT